MQLTPREKDKLLIAMAAMVARRRLERGVKLNHPEAVALITDFVVEGAREFSSHQPVVSWLEVDRENLRARVLGQPKREDLVQIQLNEQLIVELYSK